MRQAARRDGVRGAGGAGGARGSGGAGGLRTAEIVLGGVAAVLLILVVVAFARTGDLKRDVASSRAAAGRASKEADALKTRIGALEGELHKLRLAGVDVPRLEKRIAELESRPSAAPDEGKLAEAVDAALERRREAFTRDIERRGERMIERLARDVNLGKLGENLKQAAGDMRAGRPAGEDGGPAREANEGERMVARGLDGAAQFFDLMRQRNEGKITQEEYDKRRGELRDGMRRDFEQNLTPEQRKRFEERMQQWRGRRDRDGGGAAGGGAREGEDGDKF